MIKINKAEFIEDIEHDLAFFSFLLRSYKSRFSVEELEKLAERVQRLRKKAYSVVDRSS